MTTSDRCGAIDPEPSPSADWRAVYAAMHVPVPGATANVTALADDGREVEQ